MSLIETIKLPDLGEVEEVEVIEISVEPGQKVSADDSILVLETDKAAMEIPASKDGVVKSILLNVGDKAETGMPFLEIEISDEGVSESESIEEADEDIKQEVEETESNKEIIEQAKSQLETIKLPDLGEVEEVEVIEISVEPGQKVSADDSILVLETDKAAMEIPASKDGVVKSILLNVGDKAETGMPFLEIEAISISHSSKKEKDRQTKPDASTKETQANNNKAKKSQPYPQNNIPPKSNSKTHAGPATRKLAREFGIDLNKVIGSGPKNRIIKEDLHAFVANALNNPQPNNGDFIFNQPDIDFKKWGDTKEEPLSKFQKTALKNLHTSWINIPHVTQHDEADITKLLKLRSSLNKKHKLKISPLAYIAKVIANVLIDFPEFNTSLSADLQKIVYKEYINIGIAVDTPDGLIVPNIKNSDQKSIKEISNEIFELASLAKDRKLKVADLKGATFTISSLSGIGGKFFTPIINPPEVGIIGLSKTFKSLKIVDGDIIQRDTLPISLSYDHRVINGAYAAKFITALSSKLEDIDFLQSSFGD
jgi:pyruvate dehydrogenase E2 component (dihydrolipoamide acetyltransferase)